MKSTARFLRRVLAGLVIVCLTAGVTGAQLAPTPSAEQGWPEGTSSGIAAASDARPVGSDSGRKIPQHSTRLDRDDQVIENALFTTCPLQVTADYVTIRNSVILCNNGGSNAHSGIYLTGRRLLVENSTILGAGGDSAILATGPRGSYTVRDSEIQGFADGLKIPSRSIAEGNHIHTLALEQCVFDAGLNQYEVRVQNCRASGGRQIGFVTPNADPVQPDETLWFRVGQPHLYEPNGAGGWQLSRKWAVDSLTADTTDPDQADAEVRIYSHNDGIQGTAVTDALIRGNNVDHYPGRQNSAALFKADQGIISSVTVTGNRLAGGKSHVVQVRPGTGSPLYDWTAASVEWPTPANVVFRNNVIDVDSLDAGRFPIDSYGWEPLGGRVFHDCAVDEATGNGVVVAWNQLPFSTNGDFFRRPSEPCATAEPVTPPPSCGTRDQQAENGLLTGAFSLFENEFASGAHHISIPEGTGSFYAGTSAGVDRAPTALYCMRVDKRADYRLLVSAKAHDGTSDSIWVRFGNRIKLRGMSMVADSSFRTMSPLSLGVLEPGDYMVELIGREDGIQIDRLAIVSDDDVARDVEASYFVSSVEPDADPIAPLSSPQSCQPQTLELWSHPLKPLAGLSACVVAPSSNDYGVKTRLQLDRCPVSDAQQVYELYVDADSGMRVECRYGQLWEAGQVGGGRVELLLDGGPHTIVLRCVEPTSDDCTVDGVPAYNARVVARLAQAEAPPSPPVDVVRTNEEFELRFPSPTPDTPVGLQAPIEAIVPLPGGLATISTSDGELVVTSIIGGNASGDSVAAETTFEIAGSSVAESESFGERSVAAASSGRGIIVTIADGSDVRLFQLNVDGGGVATLVEESSADIGSLISDDDAERLNLDAATVSLDDVAFTVAGDVIVAGRLVATDQDGEINHVAFVLAGPSIDELQPIPAPSPGAEASIQTVVATSTGGLAFGRSPSGLPSAWTIPSNPTRRWRPTSLRSIGLDTFDIVTDAAVADDGMPVLIGSSPYGPMLWAGSASGQFSAIPLADSTDHELVATGIVAASSSEFIVTGERLTTPTSGVGEDVTADGRVVVDQLLWLVDTANEPTTVREIDLTEILRSGDLSRISPTGQLDDDISVIVERSDDAELGELSPTG